MLVERRGADLTATSTVPGAWGDFFLAMRRSPWGEEK